MESEGAPIGDTEIDHLRGRAEAHYPHLVYVTEKLSDKQITWQVAAVESPKQAGIVEKQIREFDA
jgi:hypothetical protein